MVPALPGARSEPAGAAREEGAVVDKLYVEDVRSACSPSMTCQTWQSCMHAAASWPPQHSPLPWALSPYLRAGCCSCNHAGQGTAPDPAAAGRASVLAPGAGLCSESVLRTGRSCSRSASCSWLKAPPGWSHRH